MGSSPGCATRSPGCASAGHEVLLVCSGAVSAGVAASGSLSRPADMPTLQALAAAGQPRLMAVYNAEFGRHGLVAAQALVVPPDFVNRRQYLHARQTLVRLLELGCVPVINENDAIASDEIRWGDNDRIAALVSHLVAADLVVLLTDTPGLYTADPRTDPTARLIELVTADDPLLAVEAGRSGSDRGSGGMASKLQAARIASWSGVRAVIAQASRRCVLADAVASVPGVGTTFEAHDRRLGARKLWIGFASAVAGTVVVDDGARRALVRAQHLVAARRGARGARRLRDRRHRRDRRPRRRRSSPAGMVALDGDVARRSAGHRSGDLPGHVARRTGPPRRPRRPADLVTRNGRLGPSPPRSRRSPNPRLSFGRWRRWRGYGEANLRSRGCWGWRPPS